MFSYHTIVIAMSTTIVRDLALHVANHSPKVGAQFAGLRLRSIHLARMRVALGFDRGHQTDPRVALAKRDAVLNR